jgi:hypothetical protein
MREVLPGVFHWQAFHPKIQMHVASYWIDEPGVLVDPLIPPDAGIEWFAGRDTPPTAIVLSNRHHYRDSAALAGAFDCPVLCNSAGLHEFTRGEQVTGFDPGERLPGGLLACDVGAICPDETALHLADRRALFIADGIVRSDPQDGPGQLGFVPDWLMDEPARTKQGLLDAFERLLEELEFEHLMLAHGGPVVGDGRAQLQQLIASGGRTAFEL